MVAAANMCPCTCGTCHANNDLLYSLSQLKREESQKRIDYQLYRTFFISTILEQKRRQSSSQLSSDQTKQDKYQLVTWGHFWNKKLMNTKRK